MNTRERCVFLLQRGVRHVITKVEDARDVPSRTEAGGEAGQGRAEGRAARKALSSATVRSGHCP